MFIFVYGFKIVYFYETMQVRLVIFAMQVYNDVSYCGIATQPSLAYSFIYLSDFLSFHTLNKEMFMSKISIKPCKLD